MKKLFITLFLFTMAWLPESVQAQIFSVSSGTALNILAGTTFTADSITFTPSANFALTGISLSKNGALINPSTLSRIGKAYKFSATSNPFSGTIQIKYADARLNGLTESSLKLMVHNGTSWQIYPGSTDNSVTNFVLSPALSTLALNELTAGYCAAPPAPTASGTTTCSGSTAALTATGSGTLGWYTAASGGTWLRGGGSYTTPVLAAATTYYVQDSTCIASATRTAVTVTVTAKPTAPTVGTITHPTCALATGSVILNGLPATGTWNLTRTPGSIVTTGTGVTSTISGLAAGTYTYTVTNTSSGCTSTASASVVINAQPSAPTAPTVGTITQPTCALATGSVILNGLPATGTWTLTRTPGATVTTGTGVTSTISGLAAGTYTYTVRNSSGCTSVASANVVINAQPTVPAAPTGSAAQSFCTGATVASLAVTGTAPKWYAAATGGAALIATTVLVNGTHYYASQTIGCESSARLNVTATILAVPTAPTVGTITQPTCALATGSVILNGLPATGTWTLTRTPGAVATTGTGVTSTISGLAAGTYTYKVTNASGCVSAASANVVINAQPLVSTAPTVGTITQPTCALATGSVILNGLPATGTWTLTRAPGAVTSTGTGTTSTISGLATGTYTYTVTNASRCISAASANVVINAQPTVPAAPTGSAAQSFCTGATVASLAVTGTAPKWYAAATGGAALIATTVLVNGTHYYASQTIGCESATRLNVTATVSAVPAQPGAFTTSTAAVIPGTTSYVYTVPLVAGMTYTWSFSGLGATITGTSNSVSVVYSVTATLGTLSVTARNAAGCTSIARSLAITGLKSATIPINNLQGDVKEPDVVLEVKLADNQLIVYPNPTMGRATFEFHINENAKVALDIFSVGGQHIARIYHADTEAGIRHTVFFDQTLPSGIYPCVMSWNGKMITVKLVIIQ